MKTWETTEEIHGQHQTVDKNDSASRCKVVVSQMMVANDRT